MTGFITSKESVTIDGAQGGAVKTKIDGDWVVQLQAASQEQSGFDWIGRNVKKATFLNILIYDDYDLRCLEWMIRAKIKLDFSKSFVSPRALDDLNKLCDRLEKAQVRVIEGSSIGLPTLQGFSGMGRMDQAKSKCEAIGFNVILR